MKEEFKITGAKTAQNERQAGGGGGGFLRAAKKNIGGDARKCLQSTAAIWGLEGRKKQLSLHAGVWRKGKHDIEGNGGRESEFLVGKPSSHLFRYNESGVGLY